MKVLAAQSSCPSTAMHSSILTNEEDTSEISENISKFYPKAMHYWPISGLNCNKNVLKLQAKWATFILKNNFCCYFHSVYLVIFWREYSNGTFWRILNRVSKYRMKRIKKAIWGITYEISGFYQLSAIISNSPQYSAI